MRRIIAVVVVALLSVTLATPTASADEGQLIPDAAITSLVDWKASSNAERSFANSDGSIRLTPKVTGSTVWLQSSNDGATVPQGTRVFASGQVWVPAGATVVTELREIESGTGRSRTLGTTSIQAPATGFRWYGADVTTRYTESAVRVRVKVTSSSSRELRFREFRTRIGERTPWRNATPASVWAAANRDDPRWSVISGQIAKYGTGSWLLGEENPIARLRSEVALAQRTNTSAVVVPYFVPGRWDGISAPAGAADFAEYRAFIDAIVREIGTAQTFVILEPDALWFYAQVKQRIEDEGPYTEEGVTFDQAVLDSRVEALGYALQALRALPRTKVFVEVGTTSGAVTPVQMADALNDIGLTRTDGFAVNVSSFSPEASVSTFAKSIRNELRKRHGLGGVTYVVDTGRNGNPEWTGQATEDDARPWCNWASQRLGSKPGPATAEQATQGREFNLWVKGPGESDGECRAGEPVGGTFMPDVAYDMAR